MSSITAAAEAFAQSYAAAMSSATAPSSTLSTCAEALAAHYAPNFTSFTLGTQTSMPERADAVRAITSHLQRFETAGLGLDVRMLGCEVRRVSHQCALCDVTWEIRPGEKSGVEAWNWVNVYAYRRGQDGREGWEFVVADNEIMELMARVPGFFGSGD